jgi:hypothetical protein
MTVLEDMFARGIFSRMPRRRASFVYSTTASERASTVEGSWVQVLQRSHWLVRIWLVAARASLRALHPLGLPDVRSVLITFQPPRVCDEGAPLERPSPKFFAARAYAKMVEAFSTASISDVAVNGLVS